MFQVNLATDIQSSDFLRLSAFLFQLSVFQSLSNDIRALIQELEIYSREEYNDIINIVRILRTNRTAFGDDGPERAMDAYISLEGMLIQSESSNRILSVLQRAAMMKHESIADELLIELETVQEELLDRCFPPQYYRQPTIRKDILSVCERVQQEVRNSGNKEEQILSEFLNELEHNTIKLCYVVNNWIAHVFNFSKFLYCILYTLCCELLIGENHIKLPIAIQSSSCCTISNQCPQQSMDFISLGSSSFHGTVTDNR